MHCITYNHILLYMYYITYNHILLYMYYITYNHILLCIISPIYSCKWRNFLGIGVDYKYKLVRRQGNKWFKIIMQLCYPCYCQE